MQPGLLLRHYAPSNRLINSFKRFPTPTALLQSGRRWQATAAAQAASTVDGPPVTETNRAEATLKRFWKDVGVTTRDGSLAVTLDNRALKTPAGKTLLVPKNKSLLATLIAAEWDHQEKLLKPHALPMTSLAARAIDAMQEEESREQVREALIKYLDTDTICFYQKDPPPLVQLQEKHWDPIIAWVEETFGVEITKTDSILFSEQPEITREKLKAALKDFDAWQMAAMERATYATKSFIIGLAMAKRHITVEEAARAASVEVDSQIERWGEVEDTHDVDYQDIRRQLGSVACLLSNH